MLYFILHFAQIFMADVSFFFFFFFFNGPNKSELSLRMQGLGGGKREVGQRDIEE